MNAIYKQILMTYIRRIGGYRKYLLIGAVILFVLLVFLVSHLHGFVFLIVVIIAMAGIYGYLINTLKWQMASPQSQLMPDYRRPHLIVGGIIISMVIIGTELIIFRLSNLSLLASFALASVYSMIIIWSFYLKRPMIVVLCMYSPLTLESPFGGLSTHLIAMRDEMWLVLSASAVLSFVLLIQRLWWLNEEMPEYPRSLGHSHSRESDLFKVWAMQPHINYGSWWARLFWVSSDQKIARISRNKGANLWSRINRIQTGSPLNPSIILVYLLSLLFVNLPPISMYLHFRRNHIEPNIDFKNFVSGMLIKAIPMMCSFLTFTAIIFPMQKKAWMGLELLRPISRSDYFREQAFALMLSRAYLILAFLGGVLTTAWIWQVSIWNEKLLAMVLLSGMLFLFGFASVLWIIRWRSLFYVLSMGVFFVYPIPLILFDVTHGYELTIVPLLGTCIATTAVAGLILWDAHRRWMLVELG